MLKKNTTEPPSTHIKFSLENESKEERCAWGFNNLYTFFRVCVAVRVWLPLWLLRCSLISKYIIRFRLKFPGERAELKAAATQQTLVALQMGLLEFSARLAHILTYPSFSVACIQSSPAFVCLLPYECVCSFFMEKKGKANTRSIERSDKKKRSQIKLNRIYVWFGI